MSKTAFAPVISVTERGAAAADNVTLLMLAFEFPPQTAIGAHRPMKLAAHLPAHGINPVVVTTDGPSAQAWFGSTLDDGLLEGSNALTIHRVTCPRRRVPTGLWARRWRQWWSLGEDIGTQWEPYLAREWDAIVSESRPAAIYVTVPPFSMAALAAKLARRSGLPLILDFRDSWSQWCHGPRTSWLHYQMIVREERKCLESAAAVVTTTRQIATDLQRVHPRIRADRFHVIPNGYLGTLPDKVTARTAGPGRFVIGYVGSFYYLPQIRDAVMQAWWRRPIRHWLQYSPRREDWLYRSPFYFFQALKVMLDRRPALRDRVRVRFVGDSPDWLHAQVEHFRLTDIVEHLGRLPHRDCLEFQANCDALLATSAKVIGGRDFPLAGKTFDYVMSGRPVIAFVAEGEQKDFWQSSGMGVVCDPDDTARASRQLEHVIANGLSLVPNRSFVEGFQLSETSKRLADVIMSQAS